MVTGCSWVMCSCQLPAQVNLLKVTEGKRERGAAGKEREQKHSTGNVSNYSSYIFLTAEIFVLRIIFKVLAKMVRSDSAFSHLCVLASVVRKCEVKETELHSLTSSLTSAASLTLASSPFVPTEQRLATVAVLVSLISHLTPAPSRPLPPPPQVLLYRPSQGKWLCPRSRPAITLLSPPCFGPSRVMSWKRSFLV